MNSKLVPLFCGIFLSSLLLGGCTTSSSSPHEGMIRYNGEWITVEEYEAMTLTESAKFTIINWDQTYYGSLEEWGIVTLTYQIENTGDVDIDYYEVSFTAECVGGHRFNGWTNGLDIAVGAVSIDENMIYVDGLEVIDIVITNWGFDAYSVDHTEETAPSYSSGLVARPEGPEPDTDYVIKISGTEGLEFSGSYTAISWDGRSSSRSLDGLIPAMYGIDGDSVSAIFQKEEQYGCLFLDLLYNGQTVANSDTCADFGIASVSY